MTQIARPVQGETLKGMLPVLLLCTKEYHCLMRHIIPATHYPYKYDREITPYFRELGCWERASYQYGVCDVANYQIILGWKTYKCYYETGELPNPRPTQPKKNRSKVAFGPLFPTIKRFFRGLGLVLHRKQTTRNPIRPNYPQTS